VTEQEITELRSRIIELEQSDKIFARRANLLLDEIMLTRDQIGENAKAISESRRDIDQLATRMGELAQSVSELRQNQQLLTFTVTQVAESITILRQTQTSFVEQAIAERQSFQTEIQRIWEYLMTTRPNGRGEQGGEA
jgi:chromosome segregation ATPase